MRVPILISLLLLSICSWSFAQQPGLQIFTYVEQMAEFQGGQSRLNEFLVKNLQYPEIARLNEIEGRVTVKFVVDTAGNVISPQILRSVYPVLDKEVLRIMNTMPKWRPGMQGGKPVNVYYTLPVVFRLEDPILPPRDNFSFPYYTGDIEEALNVTDEQIGNGRAYVKVTISEKGLITNAKVTSATYDSFAAPALKVVMALSANGREGAWKPAMENGKPVAFDILLPVYFNPDK